jgi:hypothetical protein
MRSPIVFAISLALVVSVLVGCSLGGADEGAGQETSTGVTASRCKDWALDRDYFIDGPEDIAQALERAGEELVGLRAVAFVKPYVSPPSRSL